MTTTQHHFKRESDGQKSQPAPSRRRGRQAAKVDFEAIKVAAEPYLLEILESLAPEGELQGNEYVMLNPRRPEDCNLGSFKFNVGDGSWADFACGAAGGDIISLVAYMKDVKQHEAAMFVSSLVQEFTTGNVGAQLASLRTNKARIRSDSNRSHVQPNQQNWKPPKGAALKMTEDPGESLCPVPTDAPPPPVSHPTMGRPGAIHTYTTATGAAAFFVFRYEASPSRDRKVFMPLTFRQYEDGTRRWDWKGLDQPAPLFNLQKMLSEATKPVLIVEGEKSVAAAEKLMPDVVVVTTAGGSNSPGKTDLSPLVGRQTIIWPDNDESGAKFVDNIIESLGRLDRTSVVLVMDVPQFLATTDAGAAALKPCPKQKNGWDAADAVNEGWTAEHMRLYLGTKPLRERAIEYSVAGFEVLEDGVKERRTNKDGDVFVVAVSTRFDVLGHTKWSGTEEWGYLLSAVDPRGERKTFPLRGAMAASKNALGVALMERGIGVHNNDAAYRYILEAVPKKTVTAASQPGWHSDPSGRDVFVVPGRVIGPLGHGQVVFEVKKHEEERFGLRGNLAEWNQEVARRCVGNSRLTFAVSVALAGPVLKLLGEENGGYHYFGRSSIGKTSALRVVASVWGNPTFMRRWKTTGNALEQLAVSHNDTVLILDELHQIKDDEIGDAIYGLGNGTTKERMNRDTSLRDAARFRLVFLSSGEESVRLRIEAGAKSEMGGQEVRLPSIDADAGGGCGLFEQLHGFADGGKFAQALDQLTSTHYGVAGQAWLEYLVNADQKELVGRLQASMTKFVQDHVPAGSAEQVFRVGRRFALAAAAGEAAIAAGVLAWPEGEAVRGAKQCLNSWIVSRGGIENQERLKQLRQVRSFIARFGEMRFAPWDESSTLYPSTLRTNDRVGWRKANDDGREDYYVLPDMYNEVLCQGLDPRAVTKTLKSMDLLVVDRQGKPQIQARPPGHKDGIRLYCIKADILDTSPEEPVVQQVGGVQQNGQPGESK